MRRAMLLLEVVVSLALLAALGVAVLRIQSDAVRQLKLSERRSEITRQVEELLWTWSEQRVPVTLPATGQFDESTTWQRTTAPVRVATGLIVTQVSVVVRQHEPGGIDREVMRVDWLAPRPEGKR